MVWNVGFCLIELFLSSTTVENREEVSPSVYSSLWERTASHMEEVRWSQRQDTNILFSLFVQPVWSDSPFPVFNRVTTQVHSHFPDPDFCKCCQQRRLHFCVPVSNAVIGTIRTLRHWHLLPRSSTFRCLCLCPPILLALWEFPVVCLDHTHFPTLWSAASHCSMVSLAGVSPKRKLILSLSGALNFQWLPI